MKKMSYVSAIDAVLAGQPIEGEVAERLTALRESVAKRSASKSNKPTKAQLEREAQYARLIEFLGENPASTCAAIADEMGVTLHSATGLLTQLRKRGQVMREYEGKTPVYSLGSEAEVEGE